MDQKVDDDLEVFQSVRVLFDEAKQGLHGSTRSVRDRKLRSSLESNEGGGVPASHPWWMFHTRHNSIETGGLDQPRNRRISPRIFSFPLSHIGPLGKLSRQDPSAEASVEDGESSDRAPFLASSPCSMSGECLHIACVAALKRGPLVHPFPDWQRPRLCLTGIERVGDGADQLEPR